MGRKKGEPRRKNPEKRCKNRKCRKVTRWLSVDGLCWDCAVQAVRNRAPLLPPKDVLPEDSEEEEP